MGDRGATALACEQAHHGGQAAACALPHHADGPGGTQLGLAGGRPGESGVAVLDRGGEPVSRREPVVHRHDDRPDLVGDRAADPVAH
ncbi:MAG TPA: hypothetical protein VMI73_00130 [Trebonia sp.]|nr:hypothetical protein [Trebonia sp.]